MIVAPHASGATVHVALEGTGEGAHGLRLELDDPAGRRTLEPALRTTELATAAEWPVADLAPGTRVSFRITHPASDAALATGRIPVAPAPGESFEVALVADTHVLVRQFDALELADHPIPDEAVAGLRSLVEFVDATVPVVADRIGDDVPEIVLHLGDAIDSHGFGFNQPVPDSAWLERGWLRYRALMAPALDEAVHLLTIGNWEGENGDFPAADIASARAVRGALMPTPARGAIEDADYYAVEWGDARFIVLNVMTYTPTPHLLTSGPSGRADDWTLGEAQKAWLEAELTDARSDGVTWPILAIHHTVGGAAGDAANSAYGRGGGQAAEVGEQAWLHALMREHGVQLFLYGHDHVFAAMEVDGVHYVLPGRAGAPWAFGPAETGYARSWPDPGYGRLTVGPTQLRIEFVRAEDGAVLHTLEIDRGSLP